MTWFRVDDTFAAHPKVRRAGLPAVGLWTVAGSWSSQQLTEGFIPEWFVDTWPSGRKLAARLVAAELWFAAENGPEKGWRFKDWTDTNPTAEKERARRAAARERQKRAREKAAEEREQRRDAAVHGETEVTGESRNPSRVTDGVTSRVTDGVSHAPPYPTRPDPSRSSLPTEETPTSGKTSRGGSHESNARDSPPRPPLFPDHCPDHADNPVPPRCGGCEKQKALNRRNGGPLPDYRTLHLVAELCGECDDRWIETPTGLARCPRCGPFAKAVS